MGLDFFGHTWRENFKTRIQTYCPVMFGFTLRFLHLYHEQWIVTTLQAYLAPRPFMTQLLFLTLAS